MRRLLVRFLHYLIDKDPSPMELRAKELIKWANTAAEGTSGEYKKWQMVAKKLRDEFPDVSMKDINFTIEKLLQ